VREGVEAKVEVGAKVELHQEGEKLVLKAA